MSILRRSLKKVAILTSPFIEDCVTRLAPFTYKTVELNNVLNRQNQMLLKWQYCAVRDGRTAAPTFADVEFRSYSQNGEDGILLYIFSLIGVEHRKSIEICAGNGIECNTANLVINHGWQGLMVDGDKDNIRKGRAFYCRCRDTLYWPPRLVEAWVTTESVNAIILDSGFAGEVDLLSLDLDGIDYWIWKAIDAVQPRVVVVEYNHLWGPEKSVTVPYRPDFRGKRGPHGLDYFGASLGAFAKLAREKGYRLVGCQNYGTNAFFVRRGLGEELLPEIAPTRCFQHPRVQFAMSHRLPNVADREWVEV